MKSILIIGLTGRYAAGKGEVANYFKSKGFSSFSLSDVLRKEAKKAGIGETRQELISFGKAIRKKYGAGILAKKLESKLKKFNVVDSIRHPEEIKVLQAKGNFFLIGIDASVQIRFKRALARARPGDPKTLTEFRKKEKMENSKKKDSQQLGECFKQANYILINDSTLASLQLKFKKILKKIFENLDIKKNRVILHTVKQKGCEKVN